MTDTSATQRASAPQDVTGWAGWVVFAGIMLILLGAFQAIEGLVAVFGQAYNLVGPEGLVVNGDYTASGWVHLILGIVGVAAGIGLIMGQPASDHHAVNAAAKNTQTVERPCRVRPPAGRTSGLRASPSTVDLTGVGRRLAGEQGRMEERHAALTA